MKNNNFFSIGVVLMIIGVLLIIIPSIKPLSSFLIPENREIINNQLLELASIKQYIIMCCGLLVALQGAILLIIGLFNK